MIRWPAEWENQSAVLFSFPRAEGDWGSQLKAASKEIAHLIAAASRFVKVLVLAGDADWASNYKELLTRATLVEIPTNDCWIRDYGPIGIYSSEQLKWLDFRFNAWGQKYAFYHDNLVNARLWAKDELGPHHMISLDWVLEGGSIETDGQGTILTTTSCLLNDNRNPGLIKEEIEELLKQKLGGDRVVWLDHGHLIGDDTDGHIDTLVRFCSPNTIAYVSCEDPGDAHYLKLKKVEQQLRESFPKHQLVPLPLPPPIYDAEDGHRLPATYANFLITNGAVLLPTYGLPSDQIAVSVLEKVFPNRELIPLSSRAIIHQHGSFHCLSMQLPAF